MRQLIGTSWVAVALWGMITSLAVAEPPKRVGPNGFLLWESPREVSEISFEAGDGTPLTLTTFGGKLILLNIWATWCGPCINQRPHVLELARKYEANSNFEVLLISVDSSIDNWLNFLEKEKDYSGINLFIENGMRSSFGNDYNIKAIPRYILIDKNGKILSADITEPSKSIELLIDAELKN